MIADLEQVERFLRWVTPEGPWSLGAIQPDDDGLAWLTTSDLASAATFAREHSAKQWNCYFQPNICRRDLGTQRAGKQQVMVALFIHADVDPPTCSSFMELEAWQAIFAEHLATEVRPTAAIFSGSGWQILLRLTQPVVLFQRPDAVADIEGRNYALLRQLDSKHPGTHNVDRLLRLPGTPNWPNKKKRQMYGRVDPVMSFWAELGPPVALVDLPHEDPPAVATIERTAVVAGERIVRESLAGRLPDWLLAAIVDGPGEDGDRSKAGYAAVCQMIRYDLSDETIAAILGDPSYAISGHYLDQRDVERAIGRAIDHAHAEVDAEVEELRELAGAVTGWAMESLERENRELRQRLAAREQQQQVAALRTCTTCADAKKFMARFATEARDLLIKDQG